MWATRKWGTTKWGQRARWGYRTGFNPIRLFRGGKQGVECMSVGKMFGAGRLCQDANGTEVVDSVEQPVGLMLDGSQGVQLGPELLPSDLSQFLHEAGSTFEDSGQTINGLTAYRVKSADGYIYKSPLRHVTSEPFSAEKFYQLRILRKKDVDPVTGSVYLGGEPSINLGIASSPEWNEDVILLQANGPSNIFEYWTSLSVLVASVSLREIKGNHLYQKTSTARPVLSARVNGLKNTEDLSEDSWIPVYGSTSVIGTDTINFDVGVDLSMVYQIWYTNAAPGMTFRGSIVLSGSGTLEVNLARVGGGPYEGSSIGIELTAIPTRYEVEHTIQFENQTGVHVRIERRSYHTATQVTATKADLRYSNDGVGLPSYQRVGDVDTLPSDYDTIEFPKYLRFDGVDDFMKVSGLDMSGSDEVFVVASVRQNGTTREMILAFEPSEGLFYVDTENGSKYRLTSKGTTASFNASGTLNVPSTHVVSGQAKISTDKSILRLNSMTSYANAVDQGAGNYGNHDFYIGMRGGASLPFSGGLYGFAVVGWNPPDSLIVQAEKYMRKISKTY